MPLASEPQPRRARVLVAALAALLLQLAFVGEPGAQDAAPKILVIDVQKIMQGSSAVEAIQQQLAERREAYQAELKQKEQEIREEEKALVRERSRLSGEAFAERRRALEQKVSQVQREVQERQQELAKLQQQGMARVNEVLVRVAQKIAEEQDADLVLGKTTVVIVKPRYEITDLVLRELNETLPTVPLQAEN
ncbi:MAG: OmpH family outer membrane protein [Rhodovibrionaceae bacterium]|nr:OmpH family outer membrane protein [Rhodovibrionaceae bacterium]